jgi:hypothetical protein
MNPGRIAGIVLALAGLSCATTLEQLSLASMIQKSTTVVRATVTATGTTLRGSTLYTTYTAKVSETWKGASSQQLTFAVPGGITAAMRQTYAGAPDLTDGQEYVLFLWTSRTGLTQIIGLSQGLFGVVTQNGQCMVTREAITDNMVNANGQPVQSENLTMLLTDLRGKVQTGVSH